MDVRRMLILGAGPAGYTAAIYAARSGLKPLLFEGDQPGGQLMITTAIDNFPGFPNGIQGPALMNEMRTQAEKFGTEIVSGLAENVDLSKRPFKVTANSIEYFTETLIIATGASARWLGIESEQKLRGKGVSACATCDGFFFKNQRVMVVGGGDTAIEEAVFLTRFAKEVSIIHRRDKLRASDYMQKLALKNEKIKFIWDSVVEDILDVSKNKVTGIKLKNVKTGVISEHPCDGVFLAVGHKPNSELFAKQLKLDASGYIITLPDKTATNIEGVFAAGDVQDPHYRQAITAAGTGCMAAIEAERFLAAL